MTAWIEELERLDDEAWPSPWPAKAWYGSDDGGWAAVGPHHEGEDDEPEGPLHEQAKADAALIAAMRNALPRLLAAARIAEAVEEEDAEAVEAARIAYREAVKAETAEAVRKRLGFAEPSVERQEANMAEGASTPRPDGKGGG